VSIGTSTATLAECARAADSRLYGFDSFEGLPEKVGRPADVPDNFELGETGVRWRYLGHVPARCAASVILTEV
jgi:hypothetical protein